MRSWNFRLLLEMGKKKKRKKSEFRGFVDWRSMLILKKKEEKCNDNETGWNLML